MKLRTRNTRIGLAALALTATMATGAGVAVAASAHPATASPVGKYSYSDTLGDSGEGLALNANHTAVFESGCKGIWVANGSSISLDINAGCEGHTWIFAGTITTTGLNSKAKQGHLWTGKSGGTWYATKI